MCQSILPTIAQPDSYIKHESALQCTLESMYANNTNISYAIKNFESGFACKKSYLSL